MSNLQQVEKRAIQRRSPAPKIPDAAKHRSPAATPTPAAGPGTTGAGRGNSSARAAGIQRMQQTQGNRATARALQRQAGQATSVQRCGGCAQEDAPVQRAHDGEHETAQVQRGPQGATATPGTTAAPTTRPLSFDALVEQMAHVMAYQDALDADQTALLNQYGYRAGRIINGEHDFQMRLFIPSLPEFPHPVVAFRGTSSGRDALSDANPRGIGMDQFSLNREIIEANMGFAAGRGPVVVAGHSLGGALAQIAAAKYPGLVSSVITFQSPGINRDLVAELDQYNARARARGGAGISSTHYRVEGDVVPRGGEALTSGVIRNYRYHGGEHGWGSNPAWMLAPGLGAAAGAADHTLGAHQALPLAAAETHGAQTPGVKAVEGQSVDYLGETSTEDNNSQIKVLDTMREGLGWGIAGLGAAAEASTYLNPCTLGYKLWQRRRNSSQNIYRRSMAEVMLSVRRGDDHDTGAALINNMNIPADMKTRLLGEFEQIWHAHHPEADFAPAGAH
jgi:pimeloyl-ACP methyl ester carboxylesterase